MAIDDLPRQVASTRRFTLGVPRAVTSVFGDTLAAPLDDQVDALDALCASFPDLDRGRVAAGRPHQVLPLSGATHMAAGLYSQLLRHELAFLAEALGVDLRQGGEWPRGRGE